MLICISSREIYAAVSVKPVSPNFSEIFGPNLVSSEQPHNKKIRSRHRPAPS